MFAGEWAEAILFLFTQLLLYPYKTVMADMASEVKLEESLTRASSSGQLDVDSSTSTSSTNTTTNTTTKLPISSRMLSRNRTASHDSDDQQKQPKDDSVTLGSTHSSQQSIHSQSESDKEKQKKEKGSWQFFGAPKKSGSGWMLPFSFAMTHREKNEEIHKIFVQLPTSEKLIDDYSSALQRDILIHGRLYLTQNWLCFYANIFSWETLLTIPLKTVTSITKERTALLIPNAILITTTVEKYGFSSLVQRDISYNIIFKVWQNSLQDQPESPLELVKAARKAWGDSMEVGSQEDLWGPNQPSSSGSSPETRHRNSLPTHLEIGQVPTTTSGLRGATTNSIVSSPVTSSKPHQLRKSRSLQVPNPDQSRSPQDMSEALNPPLEGSRHAKSVISEGAATTSTETTSTEVIQTNNNGNQQPLIQPRNLQGEQGNATTTGQDHLKPTTDVPDKASHIDSGDSSEEFEAFPFPDDQAEVTCGCEDHVGMTIINDIYNCEVETIFQLLFTDSDFYRSFLKSRKTTNIEIGDWSTQADSTRLRDLSYTLSLNYSFGPKFSPCIEHQVYFKNGQPGVRHIVRIDVINSNIPYGDTFYVSCLFCMTRVAHNQTRLRVTSNICFKKNCWGVVKNLIERNAGDGLRSYYSHLDTALKEYLVTLPAKRLHNKTRRTSRRRHRRQPSLTKSSGSRNVNNVNEDTSSLRKRGNSASHHSFKLSDNNKASEEDIISSSSGEHRSNSNSLPKINVALTVLLGLLLVSNIALYHQLMGYQSTANPIPVEAAAESLPSDCPHHQYTQISSLIQEWPTKQEDWIRLFETYWNAKNREHEDLRNLLQEIHNAMQQVESTIQKTRKLIENHLQSNDSADI